jgi:hypothetical protein
MGHSPPPPPPQMGNGGSPPAHLSLSPLSDPSWWLPHKWSQPPPRAPDWVFEYYRTYSPLHGEGWLQRALREDKQAAGLMPPELPGGPIRLGARARAERAYQDWKWALDELWEDERHRLHTAARKCLLDEEAARQRQEATRRQQLLDERAAHERQEAAHRQKLLNEQAASKCQEAAACARQEETAARARQEEAARRQHAAEARKTAAAQLIFLWLRRRRHYARLACQTSRRQQREAALARQQHEDECFARALQAEKQRMQVAAAQAKVLADEAKERHRQAEATIGEQRRQAAAARKKQAADEQRAAESAALALVEERCRQEALLAAEADVQRRHKEVLVAEANIQCRHEALLAAEADIQCRQEALLAAEADVQRCHEEVLAAEADVQHRHEKVLAAEAADVHRRHESAARATESDAAIERIRIEFALCAAPLDAILAEIACEEAAITTTLSPRRPTSYVDAVLFNLGGGTQPSLPLAGSPAFSSPDVDSQRQTVRPRARPRRRTGRRNIPRAPSLYVAVAPTHPELLQGGLHTPASTTLARATSLCRSVVSSTTPSSMAPPTPSLLPFTFLGDVVHSSSGGGGTYPFRVSSPPRKRTRRKPRPRRVCQRHGPRAPNQVEPLLCGQRHWPRAPNQSTCDGWD